MGMKAIYTLLMAVTSMAAGSVTFSATGTVSPVTTGTDPFGNQWLIGPFGPIATWGIPGVTNSGSTFWMGPDLLLEVRVQAIAQTALGGVPLAPLPVNPNYWRNLTDAAHYDPTIIGNEIRFTQPGFGAMVASDEIMALVSFLNPSGHNTIQFDVTYITEDQTPEPASFVLLGAGFIGIALLRRRRLANH